MNLELVAIVVDEYDPAIAFFVDALGFELVEDSPATTNTGEPEALGGGPAAGCPDRDSAGPGGRRGSPPSSAGSWPAGSASSCGWTTSTPPIARMTAAGVEFVAPPRAEPYGQVVVFLDIAGNRWDLLGPRAAALNRRLSRPRP